MQWITRERVKVDRVACPWLIKKFVDPQAEFLFVPADKVIEVANREKATPFDVPNVEFGHHGKECSFEAILKKHKLTSNPALVLLGKIGPVCQLREIDLGIAVGSAAKTASLNNVDARCQTRIAAAARHLGIIKADLAVALSMSISHKNIFFDKRCPEFSDRFAPQ